MRKLFVVLGILLLLPVMAFPQIVGSYYVNYFSGNTGAPGAPSGALRVINVGLLGGPNIAVSSGGLPVPGPTDICVNIYVFNPDQEMIECCSNRITPNELLTATVFPQLTSNPLTVVPFSGVIKVTLTPPPCYNPPNASPTFTQIGRMLPDEPPPGAAVYSSAALGAAWGTHVNFEPLSTSATSSVVTETEKLPRYLSSGEEGFLQTACAFTTFLGSGRGICTSTVSGL